MILYRTIYADPPWPEYGGGRICRGAQAHYSLMSISEIIALRSFIDQNTEPNCHLYLWTTNNYLPSALVVMKEWGFQYVTMITWMKDRIGLGQYYRGITEHCLFGRKGQLPYRTLESGIRAQGATGFLAPRTAHSVKPEEMRQMIEKVSYPPRLEMFARRPISGWHTWGAEVDKEADNG